jgi:TolA-binding protein
MTSFRLAFLILLAGGAAVPGQAAPPMSLDQRVDRVEKQLKAVQRKVFPGGDAGFQAPEIAPAEVVAPAGQPATTPLADLTARVDALDKAVAQLTGQVEQDQHRLELLSQQSAQDRQEFGTRLKALEAAQPAAAPTTVAPATAEDAPSPLKSPTLAKPRTGAKPAQLLPTPGKTATPPDTGTDDAESGTPAASDDAGEAAYMAAYRLWTQKKYPQAEAALNSFVKKYPKHRRASYAQNLLGRSYLDDNQPARAAEAFAANYTTNPRGERAPDSLYYLGQSLTRLNKPTDACRVYDELKAAYGDTIDATLKAKVAAARTDAKCK